MLSKQAFNTFIHTHNLFEIESDILLAVSGGIDSVVMCHLFKSSGYSFGIAHCNFKLRAKESDEDELFVRQLGKDLEVKVYTKSFDTDEYSKVNKLAIQEAARELRYHWFEEISKNNGYKYIATAHHKDDVVETAFINLVRGTGLRGLKGIDMKRDNIIRPMIFFGRDEIVSYAKKNKISYREDSSNATDKYLRNTIRNKIIPLLENFNPALKHTMINNIEHLNGSQTLIDNHINEIRKKVVDISGKYVKINIKEVLQLSPVNTYLYELLYQYGFKHTEVNNIADSLTRESGKQFYSDHYRLLKDRKYLIISPNKEKAETNKFELNKHDTSINVPLKLQIELNMPDIEFEKNSKKNVSLDLDKLQFPLIIRKWQKGDYFFPLGMKGKKKLSDFFIDNKLSVFEKENTWILCSGKSIVWIIGHRPDNRFKVSSKTKSVYHISLG